ncbi:hypothetical protein [Clostridium sp.]
MEMMRKTQQLKLAQMTQLKLNRKRPKIKQKQIKMNQKKNKQVIKWGM